MLVAINETFGTDLLITISILAVSIAFGLYLSLAFLVFIGGHADHLFFIAAYVMYWGIPSLRWAGHLHFSLRICNFKRTIQT